MIPPPKLPNPSQEKTDREQLRLLMVFHFVFSGLSALGIPFLFLHHAIMSRVINDPKFVKNGNFTVDDFLAFFDWIYLFIGGMLFLVLFLNLFSAFCLRRRKCRMFSLVVAGLDCLQIPFGTALGVFTFMVLTRESVREMYEQASPQSHVL